MAPKLRGAMEATGAMEQPMLPLHSKLRLQTFNLSS